MVNSWKENPVEFVVSAAAFIATVKIASSFMGFIPFMTIEVHKE